MVNFLAYPRRSIVPNITSKITTKIAINKANGINISRLRTSGAK